MIEGSKGPKWQANGQNRSNSFSFIKLLNKDFEKIKYHENLLIAIFMERQEPYILYIEDNDKDLKLEVFSRQGLCPISFNQEQISQLKERLLNPPQESIEDRLLKRLSTSQNRSSAAERDFQEWRSNNSELIKSALPQTPDKIRSTLEQLRNLSLYSDLSKEETQKIISNLIEKLNSEL